MEELTMDDITVDVIMATYNARGYEIEQIESILNQTYKNLRLLIRDDGSTDGTVENIKAMAARDSRIIFIQDDIPAAGVGENFKQLLRLCESPFVFISDQDDVWDTRKLEELLWFAKSNFIKDKPCIAYAPGQVVDENLGAKNYQLTNESLKVTCLEDLILMNGGVQGCAMVINRALYIRVLQTNFFWYMHDQVLSLYAICFGHIFFLKKELFKYRQHSNNVLGFNGNTIKLRFFKYLFPSKNKTYIISSASNNLFNCFYKIESESIRDEHKILFLDYFSAITNKYSFLIFVLKHNIKIRKSTLLSIIKVIVSKNIIEGYSKG